MTHAPSDQERNDAARPDVVHDPDNRSALVDPSFSAEQLLADLRTSIEARLDQPIPYSLAPEQEPIPYRVTDAVRPVLSLADARRIVDLAQRAILASPRPIGAAPSLADRAAVERVRDAIDDAWLAR